MHDVNRCIRAVGLEGLSPPIFYQCPVALRFEIGDPALGHYDGAACRLFMQPGHFCGPKPYLRRCRAF